MFLFISRNDFSFPAASMSTINRTIRIKRAHSNSRLARARTSHMQRRVQIRTRARVT